MTTFYTLDQVRVDLDIKTAHRLLCAAYKLEEATWDALLERLVVGWGPSEPERTVRRWKAELEAGTVPYAVWSTLLLAHQPLVAEEFPHIKNAA